MVYRIKLANGHIVNWTYDKLFSDYDKLGLTEGEASHIFMNIGNEIKGISVVGVFER